MTGIADYVKEIRNALDKFPDLENQRAKVETETDCCKNCRTDCGKEQDKCPYDVIEYR